MPTHTLFLRILFLIILVCLGFLIGKRSKIDHRSISILLIYVISPVTIFISIYQVPFYVHYLIFSALFFLIAAFLSTIGCWLGTKLWPNKNTANLFGFAIATGNSGYFGLPLAIALLDPQGIAMTVFSIFGLVLYEFTYGYYQLSRGQYGLLASMKKLLTLPFIYACLIALLLKYCHIHLPNAITTGLDNFKGAYSVLGMMVVGLSLSDLNHFQLDYKFILLSLTGKFIIWPLLAIAIIYFHLLPASWLNHDAKSVLMLLSMVPLAVNTVVISLELSLDAQVAATAVFISTLLSLLVIPSWLTLFNWIT